jgi:hypothetical protein
MSKDQLKEERMKILDLLAKGIVSTDEAERLLTALGKAEDYVGQKESIKEMISKKVPFRMLKIFVDSADGDVVKIQIPIEFAKLLKTKKFAANLEGTDIDIDALLEMINEGVVGEIVNVESNDGDVIRIVVE